jgi:hypothetical protein
MISDRQMFFLMSTAQHTKQVADQAEEDYENIAGNAAQQKEAIDADVANAKKGAEDTRKEADDAEAAYEAALAENESENPTPAPRGEAAASGAANNATVKVDNN